MIRTDASTSFSLPPVKSGSMRMGTTCTTRWSFFNRVAMNSSDPSEVTVPSMAYSNLKSSQYGGGDANKRVWATGTNCFPARPPFHCWQMRKLWMWCDVASWQVWWSCTEKQDLKRLLLEDSWVWQRVCWFDQRQIPQASGPLLINGSIRFTQRNRINLISQRKFVCSKTLTHWRWEGADSVADTDVATQKPELLAPAPAPPV